MRRFNGLILMIFFMSLSIVSCSIEDEIITEGNPEVISTDLSNQDDDPETEETGG